MDSLNFVQFSPENFFMERIRHLSKNDFFIILLAVFISWPCCNGFRIEVEKKATPTSGQVSFEASSHVMGTARGQDAPGHALRLLKTPLVVFDFERLFKLHSVHRLQGLTSWWADESRPLVVQPILFLPLLI